MLRAQGEAEAIQIVFDAIHAGNPDEKLLAYQYLLTLPKIAESASSKLWIIPSEFTDALKGMSGAFAGSIADAATPRAEQARRPSSRQRAALVVTHPWFEGAPTPRVLAHRGLVTAEDAAHARRRELVRRGRRGAGRRLPLRRVGLPPHGRRRGGAVPRRRPLPRDRRPATGCRT